ncbi:MAG TPA: chemotaxis protein CheW [Gemmatimonadaceae bacterium]|nr:chemotaxis protein CheW [Gemmatimonadaceae bacterium]
MIRTPRGTRSVGRGRASVFAQMPVAAELHLVARVGAERFAFPVAQVEEVIDAPDVTWVPLAPAGLLGQLRYRDRTVSAFDGGWALGVAREGTTGSAVVLSEGVRRLALVVDDVEDLQMIEPASVRAVPPGADADGVLRGVCVAGWRGGGLAGLVWVSALVGRATASESAAGSAG